MQRAIKIIQGNNCFHYLYTYSSLARLASNKNSNFKCIYMWNKSGGGLSHHNYPRQSQQA